MSTFSELVDETMLYLYGFSSLQDQSTHLAANVSDTATSFTVADASRLTHGLIEIGDELMWVDDTNTVSDTVTLAPYGRGFRGTTKSAHLSGARVVSSPVFPRSAVKRAVNQAIAGVYPSLFAVGRTTFTFNPQVSTYVLPAGAEKVLSVTWDTYGTSQEWQPLNRYRVDQLANSTEFATGKSITVYDYILPGRTLQVVYTKAPAALANDSDDFATVTGLPASCEDLIRLGAAYRMAPFFDSPKISGSNAEADFAAGQRTGATGAVPFARWMLQSYQLRLQEEMARLGDLYPVRAHYTR